MQESQQSESRERREDQRKRPRPAFKRYKAGATDQAQQAQSDEERIVIAGPEDPVGKVRTEEQEEQAQRQHARLPAAPGQRRGPGGGIHKRRRGMRAAAGGNFPVRRFFLVLQFPVLVGFSRGPGRFRGVGGDNAARLLRHFAEAAVFHAIIFVCGLPADIERKIYAHVIPTGALIIPHGPRVCIYEPLPLKSTRPG